jgi:hypothetical protein
MGVRGINSISRYHYYFIVLLPLAWLVILRVLQWAAGARPVWLALQGLLAVGLSAHLHLHYLSLDTRGMLKEMWGTEALLYVRKEGHNLNQIMPPAERFFAWGRDSLYFYARRRCATRYQLPLVGTYEAWRMEQMVEEIIQSRPLLVVEDLGVLAMPRRLKEFLGASYEPVFGLPNFTCYVLKDKRALWDEHFRRALNEQRLFLFH